MFARSTVVPLHHVTPAGLLYEPAVPAALLLLASEFDAKLPKLAGEEQGCGTVPAQDHNNQPGEHGPSRLVIVGSAGGIHDYL